VIAQLDRHALRIAPGKAWTRLVAYAFFEGRPLTTRGRWINPLVFGLGALWRCLPELRVPAQPLYIVGAGRSGTTLLGLLLGLHGEVGFLNEPKAAWHAALPDEDLIGSYSDGPARVRFDERDATDAARRALRRSYGAFLRLGGARRVLDKYPELVHRVALVRALFPDARFLWLARNGWDACRSVERWSREHGRHRGHRKAGGSRVEDWWGRDGRKWQALVRELVPLEPDLAPAAAALERLTRQEDRAALEWVLAMRAGQRARAAWPAAVELVRYEDLARDPAPTLARVFAFAGLAPEERVLAYAARVVAPARESEPFSLAPMLEPAFRRTLTELGYA